MPRTKGLYAKIAQVTGKSYSQIRSELMKNFTAAAKRLLASVSEALAKKPGEAWFEALKIVAGPFWSVVRSEYRIPSVEEVLARINVEEARARLARYAPAVARTA